MRIFKDALEAIKEVERDLFEMGVGVMVESMQDRVSKFDTKELRAYSYNIIDITKNINEACNYLKLNKDYIVLEATERLAGNIKNPGLSWRYRKEEWERYIHNGKFAYTYSERINKQFEEVEDIFRFDPGSRQAIVSIYQSNKDNKNRCGVKRVPCSMYYQFMIRDAKVHMIYTMRSCDFLRHFGYDLLIALYILYAISKELNLNTGDFTHFIGSLHAYEEDLKERGIF